MTTAIIESIRRANFLATGSQLETLAGIVAQGQQGANTYLSVLTAHTQAKLEKRRKPKANSVVAIVNALHEEFYPHVLKGVGDVELPTPERNRRATFARSAASTLRKFVKRGGDVRGLDAATVSKSALANFGRKVPAGTRAERSFTRATQALARAVQRIAKTDPNEARERIAAEVTALEEMLEAIPAAPRRRRPAKKASRTARVTRAGVQRAPAEHHAH